MNQLPISDITLRDYFASQIVASLIADKRWPDVWCQRLDLVAAAYKMADAMIEERNRDPA
jgi:hypothetical protein